MATSLARMDLRVIALFSFHLGNEVFLILICLVGTSENTGKQSFQVLFRQLCHCLTQNSKVES